MGQRGLAFAAALVLWPAWGQAAAPIFDSIDASSASVLPGATVSVQVDAHDPDCGTPPCTSGCGQYLRYDLTVWSADGGTFTAIDNGVSSSPYTATADWQAPATEGTYTLQVSVGDSGTFMCGGRSTTSQTLSVLVTSNPNAAPVVEGLTVDPAQLFPGETASLACSASDGDGDPISYDWSADGGTVTPGAGGTATFTAAAPGVYTVRCTATDPLGAAGSDTVGVAYSDVVPAYAIADGLVTPQRLAVDAQGNVHVVDRGSGGLSVLNLFTGALVYRVRVHDATSVAVDWNGNLVIGGEGGARVVDRLGGLIGTLHPGVALDGVSDVAVDAVNRRYVVLHGGPGRVAVYDEFRSLVGMFGSTGDGADQFKSPRGIAVSPAGEVVVGDGGHGQIKVFAIATGPFDATLQRSFGSLGGGAGEFVRLDDVAVDSRGVVYASDSFQSWVQTFEPDGSPREVFGTHGAAVGQLMTPTGVAPAYALGKVVVASLNSSSLQVFDMSAAPPPPLLPEVETSPASLTFPPQAVGAAGASQPVTLTNIGDAPLGIHRVTVNGTFGQGNDCGPFLDAASSCSLEVTFAPETAGGSSGSLTIDTSAGRQTVPLTGTGFLSADILASPARLAFADQETGTISATQPVTLTNTGTVSVNLAAILVSEGFGVTNGCPGSLLGGASCTLDVHFAPGHAEDHYLGTLTVRSDGASSPHVVSLEGRGVALDVTASPSFLDFGRMRAGETSAPQTIQVYNTGSDFIQFAALVLEGDRPDGFTVLSDGCSGGYLTTGTSCELTAVFNPPAEDGAFSAQLRIPSRATDSPDFVTLTGWSGTPPIERMIFEDDFESGDLSKWSLVAPAWPSIVRLADPEVGPRGQADFPVQSPGTRSPGLHVNVVNGGDVPLQVGTLALKGTGAAAFEIEQDRCSGIWIDPGRACSLTVVFAPPVDGSFAAEVLIPNSSGTSGAVALSATTSGG